MISTWPPNGNCRILEFKYSCGNQRHFHFLNNHHWLYWRQKAFSWGEKWLGFNNGILFPVIKFTDCLQLYHGQGYSVYKSSFCVCVCVWCTLSLVWLFFATQWTVAHQAPPSMEFSRQEYWSGLPFPPAGGFPDPGIESESPAVAGRFFSTEPPGKL